MTDNHPDAGLLRLDTEYRTLLGEINASKHFDAEGEIVEEATDRMNDLERKIADTPAESYAGIGIKLLIGVDNFCPLNPGETRTTDDLNIESALADAKRLAGDITELAQPKTVASDSGPDAGLLCRDETYTALLGEINAGEHSVDGTVSDLAFKSLTGLEEAIAAYPVHTLAGVAAKLRVVKSFIGSDVPVLVHERCAYAALEAVERLLAASTEDPFEALAAEWAEQKAECARLAKAEEEAGEGVAGAPSDAAIEKLDKIEIRIAATPTTTLLGIVTKLRTEVHAEVDYQFSTTENVIKTTLAGAEHLLRLAGDGRSG